MSPSGHLVMAFGTKMSAGCKAAEVMELRSLGPIALLGLRTKIEQMWLKFSLYLAVDKNLSKSVFIFSFYIFQIIL